MVNKTQTWALGEGGSLSLMDLCVSLTVVKYTLHEIYCEWLSKLTALTVMPPSPQSSREHFCHPQGNQHSLAVTLYPTPLRTLATTSLLCVPLDLPVLTPTQVQSYCGWASTSKHGVVEVLLLEHGSALHSFSAEQMSCKDDTPSLLFWFLKDMSAGRPQCWVASTCHADQIRPYSSLSLFECQDAGLYGLPFPPALSSGFLWDVADRSYWQDIT